MAKRNQLEPSSFKGPSWFLLSVNRINKIGWRAFLVEQIEDPTAIWVNWDPVEELERWDSTHPVVEQTPVPAPAVADDDLGISDDDHIDDDDLPF